MLSQPKDAFLGDYSFATIREAREVPIKAQPGSLY